MTRGGLHEPCIFRQSFMILSVRLTILKRSVYTH